MGVMNVAATAAQTTIFFFLPTTTTTTTTSHFDTIICENRHMFKNTKIIL